jgi:hypothetical protein
MWQGDASTHLGERDWRAPLILADTTSILSTTVGSSTGSAIDTTRYLAPCPSSRPRPGATSFIELRNAYTETRQPSFLLLPLSTASTAGWATHAVFSLSAKSMAHVELPGCFRNIQIVRVEPGGMTMLSPSCIVNCRMLLSVAQIE